MARIVANWIKLLIQHNKREALSEGLIGNITELLARENQLQGGGYKALAKVLGWSERRVRRFFRGENITLRELSDVCWALGGEPAFLLRFPSEPHCYATPEKIGEVPAWWTSEEQWDV